MLRAALAALALTALPAMGAAECRGSHARTTDQQAMSCLPGTIWDEATGTCIPTRTS